MNQWFGEPWPRADWRASVCEDDRFRIPTPVGSQCMDCGEPIEKDDQGVAYPGAVTGPGAWDPTPLYSHIECTIRNVRGCSAKLMGQPCDHSGSYRADARRVVALLNQYPGL